MTYTIKENADFKKYDKKRNDVIKLKAKTDIVQEFFNYSKNYLTAGLKLADHLKPTKEKEFHVNNAMLDNWFFPIAFLYRQSIELALKALLFKFEVTLEERKKIISTVAHDLNEGGKILDRFVSNDIIRNSNYIWLRTYLSNIGQTDKASDKFRYPTDISLTKFFNKQEWFDYEKITTNAIRAFNTIEAIKNNDFENFNCPPEYNHSPKFLINGGQYYFQAVIGSKYSYNEFYNHIKGYTDTANILYENIRLDIDNNKNLLFPMCYLFRNALELTLKSIFGYGCCISNMDLNPMKYKHELFQLWKEVKPKINEYCNFKNDSKILDNCELYITTLNNWDGCSSTFRYPISKSFQFHSKSGLQLNLENVGSCFNEILYFLNGIDSAFNDINENLNNQYVEY